MALEDPLLPILHSGCFDMDVRWVARYGANGMGGPTNDWSTSG